MKGIGKMKNKQEIDTQLKNELIHWYPKQCRNAFEDYFLYYMSSTTEHNSGLIIMKDRPPNKDIKLAHGQALRKDLTIEQNFNLFRPILNRLPVLDI